MQAALALVPLIASHTHDRARDFYRDVLGFELTYEDDFGLSFALGDQSLRVTKLNQPFTPHAFAILGIRVADVATEVVALAASGVVFERYEGMQQDNLGIWQVPGGGPQLAWFKDPDGNVLSLVG